MEGYIDSYVAYLDILGFKNFIKNNSDFNRVKGLYDTITETYENVLNSSAKHLKSEDITSVTFNIISDSIILSISKNRSYSLEILVTFVNALTSDIISDYGLLFRGGISDGQYYSNDNITFGPALVDAYIQENKYAVLPRIIIPEEIYLEYRNKNPNGHIDLITSIDYFDLNYIADYMKYFFIVHLENFLKKAIERDKIIERISSFRKVITDGICNKDNHIRQKYVYLLKMFNKYCSSYQKYFGDSCEPIKSITIKKL